MRQVMLLAVIGLLVALSGAGPEAQTSTWRPAILSDNGMVASGHALASEAGLRILKAGGNAVDAAVAAWAVQGVTEPEMTGPGRRHVHARLPREDGRGEVHQRHRRRPDGRHGGFLQVEGRAARRGRALGERARRGGGRGACGEDLRDTAARRAACARGGTGGARLPGHRVGRERDRGLEGQALGVLEEGLVQGRPAARDGRPRRAEGPGRHAPRDRREGQRRVLRGERRGEVRRLHEGAGRAHRPEGPRRDQGQRGRAPSHQLQGRGRLRVPAELAGLRDVAGPEHPGGPQRPLSAPQQRALPARRHRIAEARLCRPQQVRRRPEVRHRYPDARDVVEGVRRRSGVP